MSPAQDALLRLIHDYQDMNGSQVATLPCPPSALEFSRMVHLARPAIIRGVGKSFPGLHRWTVAYLSKIMGDTPISVSVTPNGNADAIVEHEGKAYFVEPHSETRTMRALLDDLTSSSSFADEVLYLQSQDGNVYNQAHSTSEFEALRPDIPADLIWASEALGRQPEAVNLWIGGSRSRTSLHKDPYENIYVVIEGSKTFTLLPPTEVPLVSVSVYPHAQYERKNVSEALSLVPTEPRSLLPWSSTDPTDPSTQSALYRSHARPLQLTISAGDALFLPAGWLHFVEQNVGPAGYCAAVNYWWEDDYAGERWAMRQLLEKLALEAGLMEGLLGEDEGADSGDDDDAM